MGDKEGAASGLGERGTGLLDPRAIGIGFDHTAAFGPLILAERGQQPPIVDNRIQINRQMGAVWIGRGVGHVIPFAPANGPLGRGR